MGYSPGLLRLEQGRVLQQVCHLEITDATYLPERNSIAATPEGMAAAVFAEGGGKPVVNGLPAAPGLYYGDAYVMLLDTTKTGSSSVASL